MERCPSWQVSQTQQGNSFSLNQSFKSPKPSRETLSLSTKVFRLGCCVGTPFTTFVPLEESVVCTLGISNTQVSLKVLGPPPVLVHALHTPDVAALRFKLFEIGSFILKIFL